MTTTGKPRRRIGIVLSGSDAMLTLSSGALLGFFDKGIEFDVISTTGAGALVALQALAPRGRTREAALRDLPNLYMSDLGYSMLPFNVRLGMKNSPFAAPMYQMWKTLPRFPVSGGDPAPMQRLFNDWLDWVRTALTPSFEWSTPGLLSHSPQLREIIDFNELRHSSTRFYVSAFDLAEKKVEIFDRQTTAEDVFLASQSSSLFYPPQRILSGDHCSGNLFYSSIGHDAAALQAIWLKEGEKLDMVLALDPLVEAIWREPTDIVDSFHLMLANPITALRLATMSLYAALDEAIEGVKGKARKLPPLYRVAVPLGDYPRKDMLKWTHANAMALQKIGYQAASDFADILLRHDQKALDERRFYATGQRESGGQILDTMKRLLRPLTARTPRTADLGAPPIVGEDWWRKRSGLGLVVGGGAPNMHLSSGALCGFYENRISFDVISASGAGALPGLLYAAPGTPGSQVEALQGTVNLNIADEIERLMPMNYKVFFKRSPFADPAWRLAHALPRFSTPSSERYRNDLKRLYNDALDLMVAMLTPTTLNPWSSGMCSRVGMLDTAIDWKHLKDYPKEFYLNALNLNDQMLASFTKDELTEDTFWAALSMPWLFGPTKVGETVYTEGASTDPSGLGALLLRWDRWNPALKDPHDNPIRNLHGIVALETVGADLWTAPETVYEAIQSTIMEPIVSLAELVQVTYGYFEYRMNRKFAKSGLVMPPLYRVAFRVPDWEVRNILRWNYTNALTLWNVGHRSAEAFTAAWKQAAADPAQSEALEAFRYYPSVKSNKRVQAMVGLFDDFVDLLTDAERNS